LSVSSTAAEVEVSSAKSAMMEVASQDAPTLEISIGSSVPSVKVGQENVAVAKFDLENNDPEKEIVIYGMTFEQVGTADTEDALNTFSLLVDGNQVASSAKSFGDYVTFSLNSPFALQDGDSVQLELRANVIGEQAKNLSFQVTDKLDIEAGSEFGFGARIIGE